MLLPQDCILAVGVTEKHVEPPDLFELIGRACTLLQACILAVGATEKRVVSGAAGFEEGSFMQASWGGDNVLCACLPACFPACLLGCLLALSLPPPPSLPSSLSLLSSPQAARAPCLLPLPARPAHPTQPAPNFANSCAPNCRSL